MKFDGEESYSSISPAEFFYRNQQMAGFGNPTQSVYSTVRELVENSLDACEERRVSPVIDVEIQQTHSDTISISVKDNGIGVPVTQIPNAFGRVLYGSKYDARQRRGTFGLGVTMAILYGQISTNIPVHIHSRTEGDSGKAVSLSIDVENNQPIIISEEEKRRETVGTTVILHLVGDLKRSFDRVVEYLALSTIGSPYACIRLEIEDFSNTWGPYTSEFPLPTITCKPHPRSADFEILRRLLSKKPNLSIHQFLVENFQQVGTRMATKFLKFISFNPDVKVESLTRRNIIRLSKSLQKYDEFNRPDSKCLSPIGKESMKKAITKLFNSDLIMYESSDPCEWNGHPFILEGALAIADTFETSSIPTLYRFANRVPLLYDGSEDALTKVIQQIRWKRYGLKSPKPVAVFINLCSTRVPYKAAGKQSISSVPQIQSEAEILLKSLGRHLKKKLKKTDRISRKMRKIKLFTNYFEKVAKFSAELAERDSIPPVQSLILDLFEVDSDE